MEDEDAADMALNSHFSREKTNRESLPSTFISPTKPKFIFGKYFQHTSEAQTTQQYEKQKTNSENYRVAIEAPTGCVLLQRDDRSTEVAKEEPNGWDSHCEIKQRNGSSKEDSSSHTVRFSIDGISKNPGSGGQNDRGVRERRIQRGFNTCLSVQYKTLKLGGVHGVQKIERVDNHPLRQGGYSFLQEESQVPVRHQIPCANVSGTGVPSSSAASFRQAPDCVGLLVGSTDQRCIATTSEVHQGFTGNDCRHLFRGKSHTYDRPVHCVSGEIYNDSEPAESVVGIEKKSHLPVLRQQFREGTKELGENGSPVPSDRRQDFGAEEHPKRFTAVDGDERRPIRGITNSVETFVGSDAKQILRTRENKYEHGYVTCKNFIDDGASNRYSGAVMTSAHLGSFRPIKEE